MEPMLVHFLIAIQLTFIEDGHTTTTVTTFLTLLTSPIFWLLGVSLSIHWKFNSNSHFPTSPIPPVYINWKRKLLVSSFSNMEIHTMENQISKHLLLPSPLYKRLLWKTRPRTRTLKISAKLVTKLTITIIFLPIELFAQKNAFSHLQNPSTAATSPPNNYTIRAD